MRSSRGSADIDDEEEGCCPPPISSSSPSPASIAADDEEEEEEEDDAMVVGSADPGACAGPLDPPPPPAVTTWRGLGRAETAPALLLPWPPPSARAAAESRSKALRYLRPEAAAEAAPLEAAAPASREGGGEGGVVGRAG